ASEGTIHLDSFIYNESFDDYCSRMDRDREWADHVVVVAMARMLQMDIMIVTSSPSSGPKDIIVWVVGKTAFQEDPILLGHVWESHYMSLQHIAPVVNGQDLAGPYTQAQTDVHTPTPTAHLMKISTSGSTSSTAVSLIQAPTTNDSLSVSSESTSSATPTCKTPDIMQAPILESNTADIVQITVSTSTSADVMPFLTLLSTLSTNINGLMQALTTGYTPSLTSTTDVVKQTATSSFLRTDLMQTSSFLPTTSVPTTTNIMLATTSASTPSTTIGSTPCPSATSTTVVMQAPIYIPTTTNIMLATSSASTPSTTIGSTPCSSSTSTTVVMHAPTYIPTTTNSLLATTSVSTPSTTTGSTPCLTSTSTTAGIMQAPSSGLITIDIMQASASGSKLSTTTGSVQCPTSALTTANLMQAPALASTPDIQSPSSGSTTNAMQPQASSSMPSTTADVMHTSLVDDRDRYMHIACLLVNVGSRVVRRLLHFHMVTPSCTLDQYLAKKRIAIDNLRKRKILNKSQMAILFPSSGSTNLGDYDISLLSALFTNIVPNISQQQLNMIQSLRDKRNKIVAHAKSVTVNSNDYQTLWNDICRILEALSRQCNDPDFENEIPREIQGIKVSTIQGTSLCDALQTHHRRMDTLERLVQDLISSHSQESSQESDDSDS
ncbi:hypothetical protein ACJMK2_001293, partial [Sinanodonta woodiana]